MHLLSFHTQLQLCNIRKGKEQALSQLGCREKKIFSEVFGGRCQYLPRASPVSGGDFRLEGFEYLNWEEEGLEDTQPK